MIYSVQRILDLRFSAPSQERICVLLRSSQDIIIWCATQHPRPAYSMQVVTENRYNKKDVRGLLCYAM